jgi:putative ABC transport system ATP-binding protein
LSGGEQQRVSIARALINEPAILIADEPTANLDTASAMGILNVFKNLNTEHGQTIVMVTHEPEHLKIVDRAIELRDGAIVRGRGLAVETATVKCAHCGSVIFREAAMKKTVRGRTEYFCCEHCMTHFSEEHEKAHVKR